MTSKSNRIVLKSVMSLTLATVLFTNEAYAQAEQTGVAVTQIADDAMQNTGDIIVTANKREQSISKVGLTITALSGESLRDRQISSLEDVAAAVPGLAFSQSANNTPILTLRGVGYNNSSLGVYPAVSVYIDQVPLPFPVLASHTAFDLERLEVLKGPQGTLFGQNATGGAINYIAAKPTNQLTAGADISFGRFNDIQGNAHVSGPLTDNLRARLAVNGQNSDGWQISTTRPTDRNGKQTYLAGRLLLDWDASSAIKFALNLNAWRDTSQPQAGQFIVLFPQTPSTVKPVQLNDPFPASNARAADWTTGSGTPMSNRKFYQAGLRSDFVLTDTITLTSLTSYIDFKQSQVVDADGSSLRVADFEANDGTIRSFNQELRVANGGNSALRWIVGGNYENSKTNELQRFSYADDSNNNAAFNNIVGGSTTELQRIISYAAFSNVEYDVNSVLTFKAGIRYTHSKNEADICEFDNGDGLINGLFNGLGYFLGTRPFTPLTNDVPANQRCNPLNEDFVPSLTPTKDTLKEDNVSWTAGANYRIDNNTLLYVNVSRGYKAGSFPNLAASTTSQFRPATQESVLAFEGGVKAGLWDRKVQFNAAVFYYNYTDKQVLGKLRDPIFGTLDVLTNVPKSRVFGIEGDLTIRPLSNLSINAALTYLDSSITDYIGTNVLGAQQDFQGNPLPFSPKWNYSFSADYRFSDNDRGGPFIGLTLAGRSTADTTPGGGGIIVPLAPANRVYPGLIYPFTTNAYTTVDARIGYEDDDNRWKIMVWGKNIFNEYYWNNVATGFDNSSRYAGMPATYGITASFKIQ